MLIILTQMRIVIICVAKYQHDLLPHSSSLKRAQAINHWQLSPNRAKRLGQHKKSPAWESTARGISKEKFRMRKLCG